MKILMLCDFYNETLEFQENLLVKYYTKHGYDVIVIASTFDSVFDYYSGNHNNSQKKQVYFDGKAKIIKLPYRYNILNKLRAYTPIFKILEEESPDLIYIHDIMLNMLEAVKYKKRNPDTKIIMDYHADYSNSGKNWLSLKVLHGIIRKYFLDRSRKHISKIFPVVPAGTVFLNEIYKVPLTEMEVLPLGADVDKGSAAKHSKNLQILRNKYGIKPVDNVIITGGKLSPRKQTELLIRALNNLNYENTHLLIAGDASEEDQDYKNLLLQEAEKNQNIHFTGWLSTDDVYEHYAISDIAVFPASQSILWQQAISMGLPLIVGNTGHQSIEYLNLYDNIIILEKEHISVKNLEAEIKKLLLNKELLTSMSNGAEKVTKECLDWNHLIERTTRFNSR